MLVRLISRPLFMRELDSTQTILSLIAGIYLKYVEFKYCSNDFFNLYFHFNLYSSALFENLLWVNRTLDQEKKEKLLV